MLADIYVARTMLTRSRMDLHRHATFSCSINRFYNFLGGLFGQSK